MREDGSPARYTFCMQLQSVGVVRTGVRTRKEMPTFGSPARIEIHPEFADALYRIEKHSHIWVLAWLDESERGVLQVTPRRLAASGPDALHGVFAVRSPARPNPIGLTAARVLSIDGLAISVDRLDFIDGTPVIDCKPYFIARDLIFSASNRQIGRTASRESLRDSLLMQALNFHGELCEDLALAVRIVEDFRVRFYQMDDPDSWHITVPLGRPRLIDAIMGMTRATPGRGTLQFHQRDSVRFALEETVMEYEPRPSGLAASEILEAPVETLVSFTRFPAGALSGQ